MQNKLSKEVKQRMEIELKQYWYNKKKLRRLMDKEDGLSRVLLLCKERVEYIENVMKELKPFELQVFYYIFKERCDWLYCETNYNISRSTYYNIYNKTLRLLAIEWGEI